MNKNIYINIIVIDTEMTRAIVNQYLKQKMYHTCTYHNSLPLIKMIYSGMKSNKNIPNTQLIGANF